jgi:hypothetical protein
MLDAPALEARLHAAFPERVVLGTIAPHECEECDALRQQLEHITWSAVPSEFLKSNEGALPLLSQEAYVAFLPAWLRQALREPDGEVASMLLINLRHEPQVSGFTAEQASVIIAVARFVATSNYWGPDDPVNIESLAAIEVAWHAPAA